MNKRIINLSLAVGIIFGLLAASPALLKANEVDKGKIPTDQLVESYKKLSWGAPVWDVNEAVQQLKDKGNTLWIDTRPASFFNKGTVRNAILLPYNKVGKTDNELTEESLAAALTTAGLDKGSAKIIFFCQGPKCHRSYNATFAAVTEWGYNPENIIWFRAGYPLLFKEIQANAKLKRKAKRYVCDASLKEL